MEALHMFIHCLESIEMEIINNFFFTIKLNGNYYLYGFDDFP